MQIVLLSLAIVFVSFPVLALDSHNGLETQVIDLTHSFDDSTIYWPTEEGFKLEHGPAGLTKAGYFYAANRFTCAEHGGTHIDAPRHFLEGGETVEQIPLDRLIGPGAKIDVSKKCTGDADYQVTVEDLKSWEQDNQATLKGRIVLVYTGYCRHWPDRKKYLGTDRRGRKAVAKLHFPGLHASAAEWLVTQRRVLAVGIDTASIDYGQTSEYPTHVRLFRDGVPALENVAGLDRLPPNDFTVMALPMKIAGGSGSPCRIAAVLGANATTENSVP